MFKRVFLPALMALVITAPAAAQPPKSKGPANPTTIKSTPQFVALFKPAVEQPAKSTLRVQVDGKDAAVGTVVSPDGAVLTKASEIKAGRVSVKAADGTEHEAKVVGTAEFFDLALLMVDTKGLTPIDFAPSRTAPVGNWVAVATPTGEPAAVGVVSVAPRTVRPPYGAPLIPTAETGFLGVQVAPEGPGALIDLVTPGSAADKAGIKPKDQIILIDRHEITSQEVLINTLLTYKAGAKITVKLIRDGKEMELSAVLGKRPSDLIPGKGKGGNRGDMQNAMGSALSERRTGIPTFLQTDAVVKPTDCGAPLVDLDGKVVGLTIARAGRTESHVIPSETVQELLPVLLAVKDAKTPAERAAAARAAAEKAEKAKVSAPVLAEAKRFARVAAEEAQWWADHPSEPGPAPRTVEKR
ncbi:MAG TPA: trypsin-like peptidase domain-containing protein [Gemmataceae bacterium]|jgi:serine protease Do|nr:trypsin-like peptidase domain-containing protein [Gemmataceae bacterium]